MIPNVMLPQSQLPAKVRRSDPSNSAEIAPQGRDECRNECEDNVNVIQQHESAPAFLPRETYCDVPACPDHSTAPPRHVLCRQRLSAALVWVLQTAGTRAARKQPAPSQLLCPWKLGRENRDLRSSHEQSQPVSLRVPLVPCTPTACLSWAPQGTRPNPNTLRLTGV